MLDDAISKSFACRDITDKQQARTLRIRGLAQNRKDALDNGQAAWIKLNSTSCRFVRGMKSTPTNRARQDFIARRGVNRDPHGISRRNAVGQRSRGHQKHAVGRDIAEFSGDRLFLSVVPANNHQDAAAGMLSFRGRRLRSIHGSPDHRSMAAKA